VTSGIDWDKMADKSCQGLDEPHQIDLGVPVLKTFSGSSSSHAFILLVNGQVMAIGKNDNGQLGVGDQNTRSWPVPVPLPEASCRVAKIACGKSHSLFLMQDGRVFGCGSNECGQLGLGAGAKSTSLHTRLTLVSGFDDDVRDVACGHSFSLACTMSGALYSFGHPEYGQLGNGTNGQYIKDGGKGPAVQYHHVYTPTRVNRFLKKEKDVLSKMERDYGNDVKIRAVACGKNHSLALEDWETPGALNRLFTFGFGGYGRLGHNSPDDELVPREINVFSQLSPREPGKEQFPVLPTNSQKQIRHIVAGSTVSLAVSSGGNLYSFGKLSNSKAGEATMYPKMVQELNGFECNERTAAGNNCIFVGFNDSCVGWGAPVSGKFGFDGGAKNSVAPKYISAITGLNVLDVSCGYGHVFYVVTDEGCSPDIAAKISSFPQLPGGGGGGGDSGPPAKKQKK